MFFPISKKDPVGRRRRHRHRQRRGRSSSSCCSSSRVHDAARDRRGAIALPERCPPRRNQERQQEQEEEEKERRRRRQRPPDIIRRHLVIDDDDDDDEKTEQRGAEDHQVIVEPEVLSVDAFLRTVCDAEAYHGALKLGDTFPAIGYGTVVWAGPKSGHKVGTRVSGMLEAADRAVLDGKTLFRTVKLPFLDHTASLGLLSLVCGMTAYAGIFYVPSRAPRRGETVVVTAAAGAVGSVAVQLAKSTGARVVGIAGGPAKNEYMRTTLNCDAVIDYKDRKTSSLEDKIAEACPNGIDFVFDNVGGETLDALLGAINPKARVVICGAISQYSGNLNSKEKSVRGPSNYIKLAERGAEMRGYNVMQHFSKLPFMLFGLYYLWARGKVHMTEHIEDGLERFPHALRGLFTGENIGKTMVRIRKEA